MSNFSKIPKYANGVNSSMKIYIQEAIRGPLQKFQKKKKQRRNLRCFLNIPSGSILLRFLYRLALMHLGCCDFSGYWDHGEPRVHEEHWRKRVGKVRHAVWEFWMISTDVVFEHTTPVTVGKDQIQGLLVVLFYGFFIFDGLGLKKRYFIFCRPDL